MGSSVNVAVTDLAALIVTWQAPLPLQAPLQLANLESELGVGVRATTPACGKLAAQVEPQSMPAGSLVTVPEPVPPRCTVSVFEPVATQRNPRPGLKPEGSR